jgi:hypothetical protein
MLDRAMAVEINLPMADSVMIMAQQFMPVPDSDS